MMCKNLLIVLFIIWFSPLLIFSQTNFVEYPDNPVLTGTPGEWDAFIILTGNVIYEDGKYHMYYCGQETPWPGTNYHMDIGYASSNDGIKWEKDPNNPILSYDRENWERKGFNDVTVLKIGDTWHMWYETLPTLVADHSFEIGYASSNDGYNWQKYGEQLNIGTSENDWDSGTFSVQDVIYNGEKFLMYFLADTTWDSPGRFQVGVAESDDGITWTKDTLLNPIIKCEPTLINYGIWSLDVVYDSSISDTPYQMWYTRYDNVNPDKVFYATSVDGKNWIKKQEPLFSCGGFEWSKLWPDDMEVCLVNDVYQMWLYGLNGANTAGSGIGYFVDSSNVSNGRILYVPTDFAKIQDAIDAASDGDKVIIEEGTYYQQFSFKGKAITVGSEYLIDPDTSHISKTIIDGSFFTNQDTASIVSFLSGEDSNSVLCGLTLQNGSGTYGSNENVKWRSGGAVAMNKSGGTIKYNVFQDNSILLPSLNYVTGGAIECYDLPADKTVKIESNKFFNNSTKGLNSWGGAINCEVVNGKVKIEKNVVNNNSVDGSSQGNGGGICIISGTGDAITISNNFIKNNIVKGGADDGGGIFAMNCMVEILNNIITDNSCYGTTKGAGGGISVGKYGSGDISKMGAKIINNTILHNHAQHKGNGIYVNKMSVDIMNNIIRDNGYIAPQIMIEGSGYDKNIQYCNILGGYEGEGNIDVDPQFCNIKFCILTENSSPCIDAGNPDPIYNDMTNEAGDSILYPAYGELRNDMGAFGGPHSKWAEMDIIPEDPTSVEGYFDIIPQEYSLAQNYPNPFNPSTTIKYSLPKDERGETKNVKLIVFDLLGREVATLVNEKQKAGYFEVNWDASNFTSGVYFYRLTAGDFVSTRKMLLIK